MKIDRVYSVIYIYNPISAGRNLANKEKKTNGRCKRFHFYVNKILRVLIYTGHRDSFLRR